MYLNIIIFKLINRFSSFPKYSQYGDRTFTNQSDDNIILSLAVVRQRANCIN